MKKLYMIGNTSCNPCNSMNKVMKEVSGELSIPYEKLTLDSEDEEEYEEAIKLYGVRTTEWSVPMIILKDTESDYVENDIICTEGTMTKKELIRTIKRKSK